MYVCVCVQICLHGPLKLQRSQDLKAECGWSGDEETGKCHHKPREEWPAGLDFLFGTPGPLYERGVCKNQGPDYRPQNGSALSLRTLTQKGLPI